MPNSPPDNTTTTTATARLGVWVFLAESIAIALVAAPSWRGLLVALAAVAVYLGGRRMLGDRSVHGIVRFLAALVLAGAGAAIGYASGAPAHRALGLWALMAARVVTTIPYVHARQRLDRGEASAAWIMIAVLGQFVSIVAIVPLALFSVLPLTAGTAVLFLVLRGLYGLSPIRSRLTLHQLLVSEIVIGAVVVAVTIAGYLLRM